MDQAEPESEHHGRAMALDFCVGITGIIEKIIATVKLSLNYRAVTFAVKMSALQGWLDFHFKKIV
ncbi:MAG: hypothetical protein U0941_02205 [Planctomycetaceae bacterium]